MHTILAFLTIAAWVMLVVNGFTVSVTVASMVRHFYRLENDPAYRIRWSVHRLHGGADIAPRLSGRLFVMAFAASWIVAGWLP